MNQDVSPDTEAASARALVCGDAAHGQASALGDWGVFERKREVLLKEQVTELQEPPPCPGMMGIHQGLQGVTQGPGRK